jgi:transcriptional regulator with XRE-family HTH domain
MEKFRAWIAAKGFKKQMIAKQLGISKCHFSNMLNEHIPPSIKVAKKIVEITGGAVCLNDIYF